jgi:hypothetical protein
MRKAILHLITLLLPLFMLAQEEYWDVYLASYDNKPGSTILNMSAKNYAPDKKLPYICVTGVKFSDCTGEGLPTSSEFPRLYIIADSVKNIMNQTVKNILTGSFSYQCERLDYFYVADTTGLRKLLTDLYAKKFPGYNPYINIKEDKNWEAYLNFLYPNEETYEYMQNQKVVIKLKEAGDRLDKKRQVDHWLYFKTKKDRECFMAFALKMNYKIESGEKNDGSKDHFKLHISRTDNVDLAFISKVTLELRRLAAGCNGNYDGWETVVVKD